jgi:hypothetical protein
MSSDSLSYSGPEREYNPGIGSNQPAPTRPFNSAVNSGSSISDLRSQVIAIIDRANVVLGKANDELSIFSIDLNLTDKRKQAAVNTWSNFSEESKNLVSYKQVQELSSRTDRSSQFILNEFKKELRKPNGSSALDIKEIAQIILDEFSKVDELINLKVFDNKVSSQERFTEILTEFCNYTEDHLLRLDSFFQLTKDERVFQIPEGELSRLTAREAADYQSLFAVNVNGLNQEIDNDLDYLKRFFKNSSDIFYKKIVKPLMHLDVNTGDVRKKIDGEEMAAWKADVYQAVDRNMFIAFYDAIDRSEKFNEKLTSIEEKIGLRENYLSFNKQLSRISSFSNSSLIENAKESNLKIKPATTSSFGITHNSVADRDLLDAHDQYLGKYDDFITGNILVDDGITIDGIDISEHTHDGLSGGELIIGSHIIDNSISTSSIKLNSSNVPLNLKLLSFYGDSRQMQANLFWLTKDDKTFYETQISRIKDIDFVDPGQEVPSPTPTPTPEGYIPPFEARSPLFIEWLTEIDYELFFN